MKTSIVQLIKEWIKKHYSYVILFFIVVAAIFYVSITQAVIKHQAKKIAELETENQFIGKERTDLKAQLQILQGEYNKIQLSNDSLKAELAKQKKALSDLIEEHQHVLDSISQIPPDTVYKNLNVIYPNFDGSDQRFPFSASQIIPMYRTAIELPLIKDEYALQGKSLQTCMNLTSGYESAISNLQSQVGNLQNNVKLADDQINNYKREIVIVNNRLAKKGFWIRIWQVAAITSAGIAILK